MNLYTDTKTDRMLFGWEIPTVMFQSLNAGFIILLQLGSWILGKTQT
jgi:POT family proton-dependent oligopeptide transporter